MRRGARSFQRQAKGSAAFSAALHTGMDALAGYGSSGSDAEEEEEAVAPPPTRSGLFAALPPPSAQARKRHAPRCLLARLLAAWSARVAGLTAEPSRCSQAEPGAGAHAPPAAAPPGKRVVQFRLPIRAAALEADDEEEARARACAAALRARF
jgi:hypothetical protein